MHRSTGLAPRGPAREIFLIFLRLGCFAFGGPIAHLGYYRESFVHRLKWLNESTYADLIALCQFLPGPTSSQVCISIGMARGGLFGGAAAWIGFTLPSAVLMTGFGLGVTALGDITGSGWLHGLKLAAVAVVASALWRMAQTLCPDRTRASLAVIATVLVTLMPSAAGQMAAIALAGLAGLVLLRGRSRIEGQHDALFPWLDRATGRVAFLLFLGLLAGLPLLVWLSGAPLLDHADAFYRSGALVFGGGHVVLPLLQSEVVATGWLSADTFLAGYGTAQALPGPLFTLAAYLGGAMSGLAGAVICLVAIFLPGFLLLIAILPVWDGLRRHPPIRAALLGVNAGVVGLLAAALYDPVWRTTVTAPIDFAIAMTAFLLLMTWRVSPPLVVGLCALTGIVI